MERDPVGGVRSRLLAGLRALGVTPESRPVVAFSGGADSAALLALLAGLPGRFGATALHVDHGLRPSSAEEAHRARALAETLGVPCEVIRVTPAGPGGPEARARRARYLALAAHAAGRPVLTAHTADDQAETVLLRLARGAGSAGLVGVRPRARIEGAEVLRPLLGVRRAELRAVLRALGLTAVEDPSNLDPAYARNRLRRSVLPALEAVLPGAVPALARAAELLAADEAYLARQTERALARIVSSDGVDAAALLRLPEALRGRVVRRLLARAGGPTPSREEVDRILGIAARGGDVHLRRGYRARSRRGCLTVARAPTGRAARREPSSPADANLAPGTPARIGGFSVAVAAGRAGEERDPCRFELSVDVPPPFVLRTVGAGERVLVPGAGRRKVRDLLREAGVPEEERDRAVLLWVNNVPVWLVGVRALVPRPPRGEAVWVFSAKPHGRTPGNEGGAPMVGADG